MSLYVLSLDDELDEARRELAREQGALYMHERAGGLVVNHGIWRNQLRRREQRIAELRAFVAALEQRLEEA